MLSVLLSIFVYLLSLRIIYRSGRRNVAAAYAGFGTACHPSASVFPLSLFFRQSSSRISTPSCSSFCRKASNSGRMLSAGLLYLGAAARAQASGGSPARRRSMQKAAGSFSGMIFGHPVPLRADQHPNSSAVFFILSAMATPKGHRASQALQPVHADAWRSSSS